MHDLIRSRADSFDSEGLELPFGEEPSGSASFEAPAMPGLDSPFAETASDTEDAAAGVRFPSGLVLQVASGATGPGQDHFDPSRTGLPLLATPPQVQGEKLSPHFTVRELVSSGGRASPVARISPELVDVLERIRERAGRPVRILSGYRSFAANREVYRSRNQAPTSSRHSSGQAADIAVGGLTGVQLAKLAIDAGGPQLAIGIGPRDIHVDVRGAWALWNYLGGKAGAAAEAEVRRHRERRRDGEPPAPGPVPPGLPAPRPGGGTARLPVPRHPALSAHRGTPPDLILRWNEITGPGEVDVVLHFHGFSDARADMRIDRDKERYSGLDFADPAGAAAGGRVRPTLGILARGNFAGDQPGRNPIAYDFPALASKDAVARLIDDCLARLSRETGFAARRGRLILTAHSGGGAALSAVVGSVDPDEVHMHDATYQPSGPLVAWAKRRLDRELAAQGALPPALRVLYNPASGTGKRSEELARAVCPLLAPPAAERLRPFFRVERTEVPHQEIPRRYGWLLLANAGADLPSVRLRPCPWAAAEAGEASSSEEPEMERSQFDKRYDGENPLGEESLAWLDTEGMAFQPERELEEEEPAGWSESRSSGGDEALDYEEFDYSGREGFDSGEWTSELEAGEGEGLGSDEADRQFEAWHETDGEEEVERGEQPLFEGGEPAASSESPSLESYTELLENLFERDPAIAGEAAERALAGAAFVVGPALRAGSRGPAVETLQRLLAQLGGGISADGIFGAATEGAVRAFQTREGLTVDGIAGPITKAALVRASGRGAAPVPPGPAPPAPPPTPPASVGLGERIARVALQELRLWHPPSGGLKETHAAALPILQRYYREGVNLEVGASQLQSEAWQKANPWSAVFVSWVMRTAGAGPAFRYSRAHREYIRAARSNRLAQAVDNPFWAYRATEIAPQVGDLVCAWRGDTPVDYDGIAKPGEWKTHADIVVGVAPGSIRVVGGNVRQDVGEKRLRALPDGRLALDGNQARFFAVLSCRAAAASDGGARPAPQPSPPSPHPSPSPSGRKLTPAQFVAAYGGAARASQAANGVPALVTLAQAALESGWGAKAAGFNFFGIKAKASDPPEKRQLWRTREVLPNPNGKFPEIISITKRPDGRYDYVVRAWFRVFPDVTTAFQEHGAMLARVSNYRKAFAHTNDPYAFATEIARGGYATDPSYERVLHSVMKTIERVGP
jgi:hypothetical protein